METICILSKKCCKCCMFQMASAVSLTALIDFYNLKKEGKVALVNGQPCLTSNKSSIEGVFPILAHLNTKTNILGESALEQALVRQWITFQVPSDQFHLHGVECNFSVRLYGHQ